MFGRGGGTRTPGTRFWRPLLYQLSYTPKFGCLKIIAYILKKSIDKIQFVGKKLSLNNVI